MARTDLRLACLCGGIVLAAFLVVNPFAPMPFDDDWSYAFSVRELLRNGHLVYNGWSAPLIITHVCWAALFAKIFGYSFVVLRFSTLPLVMGCGFLAYLLARSADLPPAWAFFFFLLLCLSPLFLPLALSFMTDAPALFYTLLCLYAFVRTAQSQRAPICCAWLAGGIVFGIIGGMGRQTVWVVPLSVVPYLLLRRRRQAWFLAAAAVGWMLVVADICFSLRWFDRQPWVYLDPPILLGLRQSLRQPGIAFNNLVMVCFTTVMLVLPAALPFASASMARLWRLRNTWRGALTAVTICLLSLGIALHPSFGMAPWLFNVISVHGVIGNLELSGHRPVALPLPARGCISALVLASCYFLLARIIEFAFEPGACLARMRGFFAQPSPALPILAIFGSVYFALMFLRSGQEDIVFDRYCLPLIPCLAIPLLRLYKPRAIAWSLLAIYIAYGLASTQDNLALAAARRAAVNRLEAAGVPSTEIAAGFEYDFYTQLEQAGHVNRYGIRNPPNAFNEFQGYTPALKCRYRVEYAPDADTLPSPFGSIDYASWLPPFHRRVFIDQFKHPWWLDPNRKSKTPDPMSYESFYD
ncbi:MAG: phospholipid carrier-dependent glycosyltransferase [Tepidisphaeraceae bacterium]